MLLPSAFPCEGHGPTISRPTRPMLPAFAVYAPLPKQEVPASDVGLSSSCRALHGVLGAPLRSPRAPAEAAQTKLRNPFDTNQKVTKPTHRRAAIPRGANKRGRDDFEADLHSTNYGANGSEQPPDTKLMSTPKRRRRVPLDMPLGLSAADFRSLEPVGETGQQLREDHEGDLNMPELSHDCLSDADSDDEVDSGYGTSNGPSPSPSTLDAPPWTFDDDRILVETVLEKLQLSKRAWNDCARRLGKDKDSLGRRWKMLLDEGEVGLKIRRGGPLRRSSMEVPGW